MKNEEKDRRAKLLESFAKKNIFAKSAASAETKQKRTLVATPHKFAIISTPKAPNKRRAAVSRSQLRRHTPPKTRKLALNDEP
jgi:hypothetical protein